MDILVVAVLSGTARSMDIWASPAVSEIHRSHAVNVFELVGRRVAVFEDMHFARPEAQRLLNGSQRCADEAGEWDHMYASTHDRVVNAYRCTFPSPTADALLEAHMHHLGPFLRTFFNISECAHRKVQALNRAYVTAIHASMPPDTLHADMCDVPFFRRRPSGTNFFTLLSWPHDRWDRTWGGHVEFAALDCTSAADGSRRLSGMIPAALRVLPRPGRVVVFNGPLLHRATHADPAAPNGAPASLREEPDMDGRMRDPTSGWRYSLVVQVICRVDDEAPSLSEKVSAFHGRGPSYRGMPPTAPFWLGLRRWSVEPEAMGATVAPVDGVDATGKLHVEL